MLGTRRDFIFLLLSFWPLSCKKDYLHWYSVGDSITFQNGRKYSLGNEKGIQAIGYQNFIIDKIANTRSVKLKNCAYSSLPLTCPDSEETILAKLKDVSFKNANLVTIALGTNDFRQSIELGTIGIIDSFTFYGGLEILIRNIKISNKKCNIILMTPIRRNKDGIDSKFVNKKGKRLIDYCNAIKNVGNFYDIQVIDTYNNPWITEFNIDQYTIDGLHPNNLGYSKIGLQMLAEIPCSVWTNK